MLLVIVKNAQGEVCAQVPYAGGALTIGRDKTRNVVLDSKAVSRHHGSLLSSGGKVLYLDEGSSNGSRVDGQTVSAPVPLNARSVIQIGEFSLSLQLQNPAPSPAASPKAVSPPQVSAPHETELIVETVAASTPSPPPVPVDSHEETLLIQPIHSITPVRASAIDHNPLDGFRITLDDKPKEAPKKVDAPLLADKVGGLLEQQIQGIRSQRQDVQETQRQKREQFVQSWAEAIVAAKQLKTRIGSDPRVLFFVIARDEREVTVKLKDHTARGFSNFGISLHHPIKETVADGIAWYAESGEDPRAYNEPKEMMEDFVRAIAAKLA